MITALVFLGAFSGHGATLQTMAEALSALHGGQRVEVADNVCGRFLVEAPYDDVTPEEFKIALYSSLEVNGVALVPVGDHFKLKASRISQRDSLGPETSCQNNPDPDFVTHLVHSRIPATTINKMISSDGSATQVPGHESVVISDHRWVVRTILKSLRAGVVR